MLNRKMALLIVAVFCVVVLAAVIVIGIINNNNKAKQQLFTSLPAYATATANATQVAVGQEYNKLYTKVLKIKVIRVAEPPLVSLNTVIQMLYNRVDGKRESLLGKGDVIGEDTNKPITLDAVYGLVTVGEPDSQGVWQGPLQHLGLAKCDINANCNPTGQNLNHIENRLMWILDYIGDYPVEAGPPYPLPGCEHKSCPPEDLTPPTVYGHRVLLVDAQYLELLGNLIY